jgi:hypothetical protein
MGNGNDLWLGLESLYDLLVAIISVAQHSDLRGHTADLRLDLRDLGTVCLETTFSPISLDDVPFHERVPKVSSVQDQSLIPPLNQVSSHSIPSHGSTSGNQERLVALFLGIQDLSQHPQAVAKDGDERRRHVRGSGGSIGQ